MATLTADLPAEVASAAYARIDRCARALRNAGDGRTMDQLRADVFADQVKIRDRECRFPTCHRPAHDSDLDHVIPYQRNGETNTANLIGLRRRHHRTKHTPGWHFHLTNTGQLHITTPTGHTYRTP